MVRREKTRTKNRRIVRNSIISSQHYYRLDRKFANNLLIFGKLSIVHGDSQYGGGSAAAPQAASITGQPEAPGESLARMWPFPPVITSSFLAPKGRVVETRPVGRPRGASARY